MLTRPSNWILLALLLAVAGCGGGGGGGSNQPLGAITLLSSLPGLHDIEQVEILFAGNGNGVAVWVSDGGFGDRLVYSSYMTASGTWSAESVLADFGGQGYENIEFKLAGGSSELAVLYVVDGQIYGATHSAGTFGAPQMLDDTGSDDLYIRSFDLIPNGSGYAAIWSRENTTAPVTGSVRTSVRPAATGLWGSAATLGATGEYENVAGASDGTGYMAVWTNNGNLLGNYYSGGSWQAAAVQVDGRPDNIFNFGIASSGLGYQVAWIQNDGTADSVFTTGFSSTFVKTANITIDASPDYASDVSIVSNGTDYLVTWLQTFPADLVARMGSGTTWGLPEVLDDAVLTDGVTQEYHVATNGGGYAVMWFQNSASGVFDVWSRVYSGGWHAPEVLDTADGFPQTSWSALASNGNGYAAVWVQNDDGPVNTSSLWANRYDGVNWQVAEVLEGGSDSLKDRPSLANRGADYAVAWSQQTTDDSAMRVNIRELNVGTGTWSAAANVATVPRGGSAGVNRIMGNAAGLTLASWFQKQGRSSVSYVAVQAADGIWGPAVPTNAYSFATNGAGFGYVESRLNPATGQYEVYAQIHDGRTWGASMRIGGLFTGSAQGISIASNGGTSYTVVWAQQPTPGAIQNIYASMFNGIGWSAPVQLDGATDSQSPQVVSNGTGYAATWDGFNDSVIPVNVFDGANWSGQTTVHAITNQVFGYILSNGTGYLIYWEEDDSGISGRSLYASTSPAGTAGDFSAAEMISTGLDPVSFVYAATNGADYGMTWLEGDDFITGFVHANVWDGSWSAATRVGTGTKPELEPSIAGSIGGFGVAWKQQDTDDRRPVTLNAAIYTGGVWGAPVALEMLDDAVDSFAEYHGGIASNGTTYAVSWSQVVNAAIGDGRHHVFASIFDGTTWTKQQVENRAAETIGTTIEAVGGKYSVMWVQADPAGDLSVLLPWLFKGLE